MAATSIDSVLSGIDAIDAIAGFIGATWAISYQSTTTIRRVLTSLAIGTSAATFGAPAIHVSMNLDREVEHVIAMMIGMTAQAYIIPGIMRAADAIVQQIIERVRRKI